MYLLTNCLWPWTPVSIKHETVTLNDWYPIYPPKEVNKCIPEGDTQLSSCNGYHIHEYTYNLTTQNTHMLKAGLCSDLIWCVKCYTCPDWQVCVKLPPEIMLTSSYPQNMRASLSPSFVSPSGSISLISLSLLPLSFFPIFAARLITLMGGVRRWLCW